jgi:hypothetical protein
VREQPQVEPSKDRIAADTGPLTVAALVASEPAAAPTTSGLHPNCTPPCPICDDVAPTTPTARTCEWIEIEDGSGIYNTCKEGEEFHLTEGLELYEFCMHCGGKIVIGEQQDETEGGKP